MDAASTISGAAKGAWQQALRARLVALDPARLAALQLEVVPSIASTNSELMQRGRAGSMTPTVLWAMEQTAGRGRLGRQWLAPKGGGLTFSIGLPLAARDWSGLSLVVGLAVAQCLPPSVQVKWPNDICVKAATALSAGYSKLGGILIETAPFIAVPPTDGLAFTQAGRWVVIGLGLNVLHTPPAAELTAPLALPAAALQDVVTSKVERELLVPEHLFAQLLLAMVAAVLRFEKTGFAPFVTDFQGRDMFAGQIVQTSTGLQGVACGVNEKGELLLRDAAGVVHGLHSGQVSLRPV